MRWRSATGDPFREYVHALPLDDQDVADRLARPYGLDTA
jgi:hypothetical protein